jgi:hypothetical protein
MRKKVAPGTLGQPKLPRPLQAEGSSRRTLPRVADLLAIATLSLGGCSAPAGETIRADRTYKIVPAITVAEETPSPAGSEWLDPVDDPIHTRGDRAPVKPIPPPPTAAMIAGSAAPVAPPCGSACPKPHAP